MKRILILFVCLVLLIAPAIGQTVFWNATDTEALASVLLISNPGTTGSIFFTLENKDVVSGTWSYQYVPNVIGYPYDYMAGISVGGESASKEYVTPGNLYARYEHMTHLPLNLSTNRIRGFIDQSENNWWQVVPDVESDTSAFPIIAFTFVSDSEVEYSVTTVARAQMQRDLKTDFIEQITNFAKAMFWTAYTFVSDLLYWLNFFFVENILMVVALFLAVPMAFAAKNSRGNPQKFLKEYFKTLTGFFSFMFFVWRMLLETVGTIRGWFRL